MTKTKLLLVSLLVVFGLGLSAPSALAQITMGVTTTVYTLRPNSNGDAIGPITLTATTAGTILKGQVITITYSQPIVGYSNIGTTFTTNPGYFCQTAAPGVALIACPPAALSLTATAANSLTLTLETNIAVVAGEYFTIYGFRVATYGLPASTIISAVVYASNEINGVVNPIQNLIEFGNGTNTIQIPEVAALPATTALTQSTPTAAGTIYTCFPIPNVADTGSTPSAAGVVNTFSVTLTENWAGAWTSFADELALATYLATNGTKIAITVVGIPYGVTVTPSAPVNGGTPAGTQTWGATPAAYTGAVRNDSNTFLYIITNTERPVPAVPESATFTFTLTDATSLQPANPPMSASAQLYPPPAPGATPPPYPAFTYPVFGLNNEAQASAVTAAFDFVDCTTSLLFPYVTNYKAGAAAGALSNWDTAIEVSNVTSDPFSPAPANPPHAAPQNGTCTFYYYSAGTGGSITAPKEATYSMTTTPVVNSGGEFAFMLSNPTYGAPGLVGGYAIAVCGFLDGAGYAELVDNANGLGNWQVMAGYLATVLTSADHH